MESSFAKTFMNTKFLLAENFDMNTKAFLRHIIFFQFLSYRNILRGAFAIKKISRLLQIMDFRLLFSQSIQNTFTFF